MIAVRARYYAQLFEITGVREETVLLEDGATIADLINRLCEEYGDRLRSFILDQEGRLRESLAVAVDGQRIRVEPMKYRLRGGETVVILPPVSGGSPPKSPERL